MRRPRRLSREEAELWSRVAQTVRPITGRGQAIPKPELAPTPVPNVGATQQPQRLPPAALSAISPPQREAQPTKPRPLDRHGLDGTWERKLARAGVQPDFTLDLHGHSLDAAHSRLDHGLAQAVAMGARVVLVITGKPRPVEAADRGGRRGAIRAKLLDWLAHGAHANRIAAVRGAHPLHGGRGAVYVILKKTR